MDPYIGYYPPPPPPRKKNGPSLLGSLFRTLLAGLVMFAIARTLMLPFEVEGASMAPNLHDRERVLVNRVAYVEVDVNDWLNKVPGIERDGTWMFHSPLNQKPERGKVVIVDPPVKSDKPYIKRVIGLPGETVTFRDGYVYIDGQRLNEPYISGAVTTCDYGQWCDGVTVPDDSVFVLGDNRENSSDSRVFGIVAFDHIIGQAWFANWPIDEFGLLPSYSYGE